MVHVVVVMAGIICVHYDFTAALGARIKQDIHSQCEVVKEEITAFGLCAPVGARRMDFHFVFAFVEHAIRCAQNASNILAGVTEQHLT